MINQYEVPAYLIDELPEIKEEFKGISPTLNIFKSIQCFANYTMLKVKEHNLHIVKKCFATAETIYSKGNTIVKTAMENVYVYSFSKLMNMCTNDEKKNYKLLCRYVCIQLMYNRY